MSDGLVRSGSYKEMIHRIFREESIPLDVMYLAQVESLFKTNALSRTKNKGIWQFGRWTAVRYGLKVDGLVDERSDPEKSTRAAARYLTDFYGMFGDWNLVLAGYNWGEANVQRLIEPKRFERFLGHDGPSAQFPAETKNHVPLIMASIILAQTRKSTAFPCSGTPLWTSCSQSVPDPIDLRAAARLLGLPVDLLKQLNPAPARFQHPGRFSVEDSRRN